MNSSIKIVGIAGSLRAASYSRIVLQSIAELLPRESRIDAIDIGALPHYSEDIEKGALPDSVVASRATVKAADAVIIVTPEFNHGLPGVLKNTLDWLSRPVHSSCMQGKPVWIDTYSTNTGSPFVGITTKDRTNCEENSLAVCSNFFSSHA